MAWKRGGHVNLPFAVGPEASKSGTASAQLLGRPRRDSLEGICTRMYAKSGAFRW